MQVTVNILAQLDTCRTGTTGITATTAAKQIVCKRNGNWKFAVSLRTGNEQGVGEPVLIDTATQPLYYSALSYYVFKENSHQYIAFAIS
jgi:hypothetical protein